MLSLYTETATANDLFVILCFAFIEAVIIIRIYVNITLANYISMNNVPDI